MTRLASIAVSSMKRTGRPPGSNQLVSHAVSTQAHHTAASSSPVRPAPAQVRSLSNRWASWVTAKT